MTSTASNASTELKPGVSRGDDFEVGVTGLIRPGGDVAVAYLENPDTDIHTGNGLLRSHPVFDLVGTAYHAVRAEEDGANPIVAVVDRTEANHRHSSRRGFGAVRRLL